MQPARFDLWLVSLDPTPGSKLAKTRPCLVISPDEINPYLRTVLIAPLTHAQKPYPTRVDCHVNDQAGQIALDQVRAVDKTRLIQKLGELDDATARKVCMTLATLFAH